MSSSNGDGVIRVGRKGLKKFAFGDGPVFEVDVVVAFHEWIEVDERFRQDDRSIKHEDINEFHKAAVEFVKGLAQNPINDSMPNITTAEALDFLARLREQYEELAVFFQPRKRDEEESPDTSEVELRFSAEEETAENSLHSTS